MIPCPVYTYLYLRKPVDKAVQRKGRERKDNNLSMLQLSLYLYFQYNKNLILIRNVNIK